MKCKEPLNPPRLSREEVEEALKKAIPKADELNAKLNAALRAAKERSEYLKKARKVSFEQLHTVYGPVES